MSIERGAGKARPATPEGYLLAMALKAKGHGMDVVREKHAFYEGLQFSKEMGEGAYRDLKNSGFLNRDGGTSKALLLNEMLFHRSVVLFVLNSNWPNSWHGLRSVEKLSVKNRALLVWLLCAASSVGVVRAVSDSDIALTLGFTRVQVRVQLQKLMAMGLVCGRVAGSTGSQILRKSKSYIYLNFLHPYWAHYFPGWRALSVSSIPFDGWMHNVCVGLASAGHPELAARVELRRSLLGFVLSLISDELNFYAADSGWSQNYGRLERKLGNFFRIDVPAGFVFQISQSVGVLFDLLRDILFGSHGHSLSAADRFCVLPPFGSGSGTLTVLTNCIYFQSDKNSWWFQQAPFDEKLRMGLVTDPDLVPRKYRARKGPAALV